MVQPMNTKRNNVDGTTLKARRKRLGLTQEAVAKRVRELSGDRFSQQALAKFESGNAAKSGFSVYIIQALDEAERDRGVSGGPSLALAPSPATITAPSKSEYGSLAEGISPEGFMELVERYLSRADMTADQRLRLVAAVVAAYQRP